MLTYRTIARAFHLGMKLYPRAIRGPMTSKEGARACAIGTLVAGLDGRRLGRGTKFTKRQYKFHRALMSTPVIEGMPRPLFTHTQSQFDNSVFFLILHLFEDLKWSRAKIARLLDQTARKERPSKKSRA